MIVGTGVGGIACAWVGVVSAAARAFAPAASFAVLGIALARDR